MGIDQRIVTNNNIFFYIIILSYRQTNVRGRGTPESVAEMSIQSYVDMRVIPYVGGCVDMCVDVVEVEDGFGKSVEP